MNRIVIAGAIGIGAIIALPASASGHAQINIDPHNDALTSHSNQPKSGNTSSTIQSADTGNSSGLPPLAQPEPDIRQGPEGGTLVNAPSYMSQPAPGDSNGGNNG